MCPPAGSPFDKNQGLTPEGKKLLNAIIEERERERRIESRPWPTIKRAMIFAVVGIIVAGAAVAARSLIRIQEDSLRAWIDAHLQGSRIAHWVLDLIVAVGT
jgi:hypothetical protein